jgi:general secretion pathway protein G
MKSIMRARKGGFTLVELLIVIMIIAILAGMMMLTMGAATDTAEATKVINDLRATKSALYLLFLDQGQNWSWLTPGNSGVGTEMDYAYASLDAYMDRPLFTGAKPTYKMNSVSVTQSGSTKIYIGIRPAATGTYSAGVADKLRKSAAQAGLYIDTGASYATYTGTGGVYMILR